MKTTTSLNHRDRAVGLYRDVLSWMEISGIPSHDVNKKSCEIIKSIAHCPQWVKSYVEGWWAAARSSLERGLVFFYTMPDGSLVSTHRNRPDYYEKKGYGPKDVTDKALYSGHYWVLKSRAPLAKDVELNVVTEVIRPYFVGTMDDKDHKIVTQILLNNKVVKTTVRRDQ